MAALMLLGSIGLAIADRWRLHNSRKKRKDLLQIATCSDIFSSRVGRLKAGGKLAKLGQPWLAGHIDLAMVRAILRMAETETSRRL